MGKMGNHKNHKIMKIDRVFISTTMDPLYYDGIKYVREAWENMGIKCVVVHNVLPCDDLTKKQQSPDDIIHYLDYELMDNFPIQNLAKINRMITTFEFPNDWCLISDADMLPMDPDFFKSKSELAMDEHITFFTSELTGDDRGKFPACYMLAKGSTFKKYMNPNNLPIHDLLVTWNFGAWDVSKLPFSDESLYRELFMDAPKIKIERHHQFRRLCRSKWPENLDVEQIEKSKYIDCHMPRPVNENMDKLKPVFNYLNLEL